MVYTVKKLADLAGVSVRTLHYYDEAGLFKPAGRGRNGYRYYSEDAVPRLQQIMFFRELDFSLEDIKRIMSGPDFDVMEALLAHKELLTKKAERLERLLSTVDKTIRKMKGESEMSIRDYYEGFSDEQVETYRREVRERWGEKTLAESEARVMKMGKEKFAEVQAEGERIFRTIAENRAAGPGSDVVQEQVHKWRQWLENFHHYPDESALELGREYSRNPEFAAFFNKIDDTLPEFLTQSIEYYFSEKAD